MGSFPYSTCLAMAHRRDNVIRSSVEVYLMSFLSDPLLLEQVATQLYWVDPVPGLMPKVKGTSDLLVSSHTR